MNVSILDGTPRGVIPVAGAAADNLRSSLGNRLIETPASLLINLGRNFTTVGGSDIYYPLYGTGIA